MEVILLERIAKLGQMGDVVRVRDGYARNYLLRQGKALRATEANRKRFEAERAQLEARNLETKREAEAVAARLDGQSFVLIRQAAESGALYGSVTARDIAEAATQGGFSITRGQVQIDRPVKELGLHQIVIALHPEVSATITINVARSPEEAEIQASGRSVADVRAEEEQAGEFAIAELFDDLGGATQEDDGPIVDIDSRAEEQPRI
ncbi:MAG: 50S ribosomal protein L9 [Paracoccaceae bacterium]|nr:MAG: 50S ribosomal protein L9 [Alphaproteobacteria bacterium]GIX13138.1 MAG: 50S ribosomal protein L9 [Paracoccaceae bacterium]